MQQSRCYACVVESLHLDAVNDAMRVADACASGGNDGMRVADNFAS